MKRDDRIYVASEGNQYNCFQLRTTIADAVVYRCKSRTDDRLIDVGRWGWVENRLYSLKEKEGKVSLDKLGRWVGMVGGLGWTGGKGDEGVQGLQQPPLSMACTVARKPTR